MWLYYFYFITGVMTFITNLFIYILLLVIKLAIDKKKSLSTCEPMLRLSSLIYFFVIYTKKKRNT